MGDVPSLKVSIREWKATPLLDLELSDTDRRLAARLTAEKKLAVEDFTGGVRISATAWVGIVRFESFEVRVTPKLAGEALGVAKMLAFTRGIDSIARTSGRQRIDAARPDDLFELLALLLADEVERVVRIGIHSDYREREEELSAVRGRMLADRQLLRRFGSVEKIWCRYDELESDTDENRILLLALIACSNRVARADVRRRTSHLRGLLEEVSDPALLDVQRAREMMVYDRQNAHYRNAHQLAWLILEGFGVRDPLATSGGAPSFAFMLNMNALFEEFVCALLVRVLPKQLFRVESQESNRSVLWNVAANRTYRAVRPDAVVYRRGGTLGALPVDAKYKTYDDTNISGSDLYQTMLYAQAYGNHSTRTPVAILIHPTEGETVAIERVRLRAPSHSTVSEVVVIAVPVRAMLDSLSTGKDELPDQLRSHLLDALPEVRNEIME